MVTVPTPCGPLGPMLREGLGGMGWNSCRVSCLRGASWSRTAHQGVNEAHGAVPTCHCVWGTAWNTLEKWILCCFPLWTGPEKRKSGLEAEQGPEGTSPDLSPSPETPTF